MSGGYQSADHSNAVRIGGDALHSFPIFRNEGGPLHKIARRITAHRQFGKQNQPGASRLSAAREVDNLPDIAGEVSYRGIDLAERNFHRLSLTGWSLAVVMSQSTPCYPDRRIPARA